MGIEEEFSPKRGMGTGMENILNGGAKGGKVSSNQSPYICVGIPLCLV
jgi:hypothetical protein